MRATSKSLILLAGIAVAVVVLVSFLTRKPSEPATPVAATDPPEPVASEPGRPGSAAKREPREPAAETPARHSGEPATNLLSGWEEKVDAILTSDRKISEKAAQILEIFPQLPEAGQVEAANHLSNLLANEDYAPLGKLLVNPELPGNVLDVLFRDALNRPNSVKFPELLEVARTPQHPKATDAREALGFLLEVDYAQDWSRWQAKMEEWLKENPD